MPETALQRVRAALIHLGLSAAVAVIAAALVFELWYPAPFRDISGGRELFMLVVTVDVIIGPTITLVVFDRRKPRSELMRDLAVVAALQVAALAYGLQTVAQARPAVVALEGSRLRVVRAIDLDAGELSRAPEPLRRLSWTGPRFVATRSPDDGERLEAIQRGLAGEDIGMRPSFWLPPERTLAMLAAAARPVAILARLQPARSADVQRAAEQSSVPAEHLGFLPMLARRTDWSALVDRRTGAVVGYVNVEGF